MFRGLLSTVGSFLGPVILPQLAKLGRSALSTIGVKIFDEVAPSLVNKGVQAITSVAAPLMQTLGLQQKDMSDGLNGIINKGVDAARVVVNDKINDYENTMQRLGYLKPKKILKIN